MLPLSDTHVSDLALTAWSHALTSAIRRACRTDDRILRRRAVADAARAVGVLRLLTRAHDDDDDRFDDVVLDAIERSGGRMTDGWPDVASQIKSRCDQDDAVAHVCDVTRLVLQGHLRGAHGPVSPMDAAAVLIATSALSDALTQVD